MTDQAQRAVELRSLVSPDGVLRLSLESASVREPGQGEVLVRMEAAPIHPSDLNGFLFPADLASLRTEGTADRPVLAADIPPQALARIGWRVGQSALMGNEGAGTVLRAGQDVQHLIGRKVALFGGGMYASFRTIAARECVILPEGVEATAGASIYVNPMTALAIVETMKLEPGHGAMVQTAAASAIGQMVVKLCLADGIPLVSIVRSAAQETILRGLGAAYVIDSSTPDFDERLIAAIAATGATLAFDAVAGGDLADRILRAMEVVARRAGSGNDRYGSTVAKKVYFYGALDTGPTILRRDYGTSWQAINWTRRDFLERAGPGANERLRERILAELNTTFAAHYAATISLADTLRPEVVREYARKGTNAKYLIDPRL